MKLCLHRLLSVVMGGVIMLSAVVKAEESEAWNDPAFTTPDGDYWRGGIWLPTAYMGTKALVVNGTPHSISKGSSSLAVEPPPRKVESLPALTADQVPQTVKALWAGYDPDREPLDINVLREWTEDGCVIRYITYTIGTFKGKKSTMAAFYALPENPKGKIPALIQMHGGGQRAMVASAKFGAENGYACLSINWGAREMEGAQPGDPNTDWGAIDATQTGHNSHYGSLAPDHLTLDPFESPRNNNWFLITLAAKRGVSFLQQQPEVDADRIGAFGHSMGGFLTVMLAGADPRIKAGAPSCGGSGSAPDLIRSRPNSGVRKKHSELYHKTIDDARYIEQIRAPMLYTGPQNDFNKYTR